MKPTAYRVYCKRWGGNSHSTYGFDNIAAANEHACWLISHGEEAVCIVKDAPITNSFFFNLWERAYMAQNEAY